MEDGTIVLTSLALSIGPVGPFSTVSFLCVCVCMCVCGVVVRWQLWSLDTATSKRSEDYVRPRSS